MEALEMVLLGVVECTCCTVGQTVSPLNLLDSVHGVFLRDLYCAVKSLGFVQDKLFAINRDSFHYRTGSNYNHSQLNTFGRVLTIIEQPKLVTRLLGNRSSIGQDL